MDHNEFDFGAIADRLRQTAYLNKGLMLTVKDERTDIFKEFHFEGGIVEYVKELNVGQEVINQDILYAGG